MTQTTTAFCYVEAAYGGTNHRNNVLTLEEFEPNGHPDCYRSMLRFPKAFPAYVEYNKNSVSGYDGEAKADFFPADFDHEGAPEKALQDARATVRRWEAVYGLPPEALRYCFSGSKGFHVEVPESLFGGLKPGRDTAARLKAVAREMLGESATADLSIYETLRLLRAPNTLHRKSGLYKVPLYPHEFFNRDFDEIRELARERREGFIHTDPGEFEPVPELARLWETSEGARFGGRDDEPLDTVAILNGVPKGERDTKLFKLACKFRGAGIPQDAAERILAEAAGKCDPPFAARAALEKVANAYGRYPVNDDGCTLNLGADEDKEGATPTSIASARASTVEPEEVRWLWERRVPLGKLTIFDGDPDVGKSVVTMYIAACVSSGRNFPDGAKCEAGNVAIVNVEDGPGDTIRPRLEAAGADLDRVEIVAGVPDGNGGARLLDIPGDVGVLERFVVENDIKLLIIDPVLTMLGGDANKDQDARKALTPLRDMAERTGCAMICVRHLNKSVGLKAIQRGGGNMGLIGIARAGSFFAHDPEDETRRIMAPHKSNLAEKPPSLVYRIVTAGLYNTARIEWLGTSEYDANALAADASTPHEKSELEEAKAFLRDELSDGPMWAKQVFKDATDAGVKDMTLRRAKSALGVKSEKIGTEGWQWRLPHVPDDDPPRGDDHVEHLDHLQKDVDRSCPDSPYLGEGDQHDQGDQHDHRGGDDHDPDHLREEALQAFTYGTGPKKALEHYCNGDQDLQSVVRSVMHYYGRGRDDPDRWRGPVRAAIVGLPPESTQGGGKQKEGWVLNLTGRLKKADGFRLPEGVDYIGGAMPRLGLKQSDWANPFKKPFRKGLITREESLQLYREHVLSRPDLIKRLPELRGKILGCWCSPERCHGDVLFELLEALYGKEEAEWFG